MINVVFVVGSGLKKDFFTGAPKLPQMDSPNFESVVDEGFGDGGGEEFYVGGEEFYVEGFGEMDICDDFMNGQQL